MNPNYRSQHIRHLNSYHSLMLPIRLLILGFVALFAGQASANDLAARARTVGVLILAGHELELARVGTMVFGNKRALITAPDDALVEVTFREIKAQLDQEQRFDVARIPVKPDDLPRLAAKARDGALGFFGPSFSALKEDLTPYRTTCQCDALLVVAATQGKTSPNSNQIFTGFAWVGSSRFDEDVRRSAAAAYLVLFLVDPASGDVLGASATSTDLGTIVHAVNVPAELWPKQMASVDANAWPNLVTNFGLDLRQTLRRPLFQLGLKPSCGIIFWDLEHPTGNQNSDLNTFAPPSPRQLPAGADPSKCK